MPRMQADGGCKDITLGACKRRPRAFNSIFVRFKYYCQKFCKRWNRISQRQKVCRYFYYYPSQYFCKVFEYDIRKHDASCEIIGGPPSPDLEK